MLKKNKILLITVFVLIAILFVSCDTYVEGSIFFDSFELVNDESIESNVIKINHVNRTLNGKYEEVDFLVNVACSLRNDSIEDGKILATRLSNNDGCVSFGFTDNEKRKRENGHLLKDIGTEIDAQQNGTSKFYIIVNDPELPGYDELYETKTISCNCLANGVCKRYELGRKE
jgi:hypothetical protein